MIFPPPPPPPPQASSNFSIGPNRGNQFGSRSQDYRGRGHHGPRGQGHFRGGPRFPSTIGQTHASSEKPKFDGNSSYGYGSILGNTGYSLSSNNINSSNAGETVSQPTRAVPQTSSNQNYHTHGHNSWASAGGNRGSGLQGPGYSGSLQHGYGDISVPNFSTYSQGVKRQHGEAFRKPSLSMAKGQAPPSVPAFGAALPRPPSFSPPQAIKEPAKDHRQRNLLGLTPQGGEGESDEESGSEDDESKLLAQSGNAIHPQTLRIDYNGRISTLRTPADIAAWVAERKKRFPTVAKAARRQEECAKLSQTSNNKDHNLKRPSKSLPKRERDSQGKFEESGNEVSVKARQKLEKLREKLVREENRVAQIEAKSSKLKDNASVKTAKEQAGRSEGSRKTSEKDKSINTKHSEFANVTLAPVREGPHNRKSPSVNHSRTEKSGSELDTLSSNTEDITSSSGSSSAEDDSEDEPTAMPFDRQNSQPEGRIQRDEQRAMCSHFARTGRCKWGVSCKYRHERQSGSKDRAALTKGRIEAKKKSRVTLYQRLVKQEQSKEDEVVMNTIRYLGDRGLLGG